MADGAPEGVSGRRTPTSTYRLQLTADFTLHDAADVLPYLHDLGVDWVYLSPVLAAEPGSTHGYDVVDPTRVDADRGGETGLAALSAEARRLGMGVLVDIVPNHVGVATPAANPWWWDVLTHGPDSAHAHFFDVDWEAGGGRLLVPVVGDDDEDAVGVVDGEVRYHDHRFPMAPGTSTLEEQHYRLVSWRRGDAELNYRRFFTITTLAGVRVEEPDVFDAAHREVGRWFSEDLVDGLRVDHPDGLRDPGDYLDRLAGLTGSAYVLVEKILEGEEPLPSSWATAGTTGYDALALVDRVLTDPAGEAPLTALDGRLRGTPTWEVLVHDRKRAVADGVLLAETRRIVRELPDLVGAQPGMADAVAEVLACFPVYRSYLPQGAAELDRALGAAHQRRPDLADAFNDLAPILRDPTQPAALRLQQTSGLVMAKGVEDNAFYRWSALTSLNEVGGDPAHFAVTPAEFHDRMAQRQASWPDAMTTLSTHDTKRSEDVRARIAVLAEAPALWEEALGQLPATPDGGFGNLLWQAAYGAWGLSRERLHAYAEKAMREAGEHTTWTDTDDAYEAAVHACVDAAYDDPAVGRVLTDLETRLGEAGASNSLAAKLLSLVVPGVPDVYQGSELGDLSLVDPDNRRPVDFAAAGTSLAAGDNVKQRVTATALRLRRDRPELFTTYRPVVARGEAADHALAFDRGGAVAVVTRLPLGLAEAGGWGDTVLALPEGRWRDLRTDAVLEGLAPLAEVLGDFPVALLVRED